MPAELPFDKFRRLQRDDGALLPLWQAASNESMPTNARQLALVLAIQPLVNDTGVLRVSKPTHSGVLVVPAGAMLAVMHNFHSDARAGHTSGAKTLTCMAKSFWWPTMARDAMTLVRVCVPCQMARERRTPANLCDEFAKVGKLEQWVLDLTCPYASSIDTQYKHALTAIDVGNELRRARTASQSHRRRTRRRLPSPPVALRHP